MEYSLMEWLRSNMLTLEMTFTVKYIVIYSYIYGYRYISVVANENVFVCISLKISARILIKML